jgi:hypothetical protein
MGHVWQAKCLLKSFDRRSVHLKRALALLAIPFLAITIWLTGSSAYSHKEETVSSDAQAVDETDGLAIQGIAFLVCGLLWQKKSRRSPTDARGHKGVVTDFGLRNSHT